MTANKYHFTQEHQFSRELGRIEPETRSQLNLLEVIEHACGDQLQRRNIGYAFARIFWKRPLLVWYEANGQDVTLLSIRHDLM